MALKADAVFEGGGVKGIGLVGAVSEIEKEGYVFENLAGTSVGAIVSSLLTVGYSAAEIKKELEQLDYNDFKGEEVKINAKSAQKCGQLLLERCQRNGHRED